MPSLKSNSSINLAELGTSEKLIKTYAEYDPKKLPQMIDTSNSSAPCKTNFKNDAQIICQHPEAIQQKVRSYVIPIDDFAAPTPRPKHLNPEVPFNKEAEILKHSKVPSLLLKLEPSSALSQHDQAVQSSRVHALSDHIAMW